MGLRPPHRSAGRLGAAVAGLLLAGGGGAVGWKLRGRLLPAGPSPPAVVAAQPVHLNRYFHFSELMRDPSVRARVERFSSRFDGRILTAMILEPASGPAGRTCFFLHGMDGDAGDGVVVRDLAARARTRVIALGGRGPAWLSKAIASDLDQTLERYRTPGMRFLLSGVSMGGTQALALAAGLSGRARAGLEGVLAFIPGGDLAEIAARSTSPRVRATLLSSADGSLERLSRETPARWVERYPSRLPFLIVRDRDDTVLPAVGLTDLIARLRAGSHPVREHILPGEHHFTFSDLDCVRLLAGLGQDGVVADVPRLPSPIPWMEAIHGPRPLEKVGRADRLVPREATETR